MKKTILFIVMLAAVQQIHAQQAGQLVIKGDLSRVKEKIAQVKIYANKDVDSCQVTKGKYAFNLLLLKPSPVMLEFCPTTGVSPLATGGKMEKYRHYLYLEPGIKTITSVDSLFTCVITGSPANKAFQTFLKRYRAVMTGLTSGQQDSVSARFCIDYVLKDTRNPILFYILSKAYGFPFNAERIKPVFEKLPAYIQNSPDGKTLKEKLDNASQIAIGKMAPDFTQNDTAGKPVSLSSFRGRYVLLDFWGSWCGFCREEFPYMLKAYNQYKNKGFTIVAVATDNSQTKWLDAIHKDGTGVWTHVSDLKGTSNTIAKLYSVIAYPTSYLIDPDGKIIARDLREGDLAKKLAEVMQ